MVTCVIYDETYAKLRHSIIAKKLSYIIIFEQNGASLATEIEVQLNM